MSKLKCVTYLLILCIAVSCTNRDRSEVKAPREKVDLIKDLQNAVAQYPDSTVLLQELIQAYRNSGAYDSAISLTKRRIGVDTSNAYLYNVLATLYFENGDTINAVRSLENAIAIYPLPEYYVALGTVYAEIKNDRALAIADLLLDRLSEKNYDDAYFIKGLYYNYMHLPRSAIKVLDSCLNLNYSYMYAYREKAIALSEIGKNEEALKTLKRAVTLQNNYDEGYFWMGKIYEKLNQRDSAIQSFQNALLYDNTYTEAREALDSLTNQQQQLKK